jgi:hypothetical protein
MTPFPAASATASIRFSPPCCTPFITTCTAVVVLALSLPFSIKGARSRIFRFSYIRPPAFSVCPSAFQLHPFLCFVSPSLPDARNSQFALQRSPGLVSSSALTSSVLVLLLSMFARLFASFALASLTPAHYFGCGSPFLLEICSCFLDVCPFRGDVSFPLGSDNLFLMAFTRAVSAFDSLSSSASCERNS